VQIKGLAPFGAQKKATIGVNFGYLKTIPLTNHWPECIDIWYEATFGQGDTRVRK